MASVYSINKGVSQPVVFKGLKAQYIWYLGGGLAALLFLFAILYICGVNMFLCIGIIAIAGGLLFMQVYGMSNKYGEHGLLKKSAKRMLPNVIRSSTRKGFMKRNEVRVS